MASKVLRLLLDACAIEHANVIGKWQEICVHCEVAVPSIVALKEVVPYLDSETGEVSQVDLEPLLESGQVRQIAATEIELGDVIRALRGIVGLDEGEHEALALLLSGGLPDYSFCTSDKAAIQAAAILALRERMISLEEVLRRIGHAKELPHQCTDAFLKRWLVKGSELRIRFGF